jgi:hypothetical protein
MKMNTHPEKIAEMIVEAQTCEKLIAHFDEKRKDLEMKEWSKRRRIQKLEDKSKTVVHDLSEVCLDIEIAKREEQVAEGSYKLMLAATRNKLEIKQLRLKEDYINSTPDAMALPMFEMSLVTSQRESIEKFVSALQRQLKKVTNEKVKSASETADTAKDRKNKAA